MTRDESFRRKVREAAVEWVHRVIGSQWPHEQRPDELAESLVAVAEKYDVPDEALIQWLHFNSPSPALWRVFAEHYMAARQEMLEAAQPEQQDLLDVKPLSGFDPR